MRSLGANRGLSRSMGAIASSKRGVKRQKWVYYQEKPFDSSEHRLMRVLASGGQPMVDLISPGRYDHLTISPDGSKIACLGALGQADPIDVLVGNRDSGFQPIGLASTSPTRYVEPERIYWVGNDKILAMTYDTDNSCHIININGSGVTKLNVSGERCYQACPSPDGTKVVAWCAALAQDGLYIYDLASGNRETLYEVPGHYPTAPFWSENGKIFFFVYDTNFDTGSILSKGENDSAPAFITNDWVDTSLSASDGEVVYDSASAGIKILRPGSSAETLVAPISGVRQYAPVFRKDV